ncbi:hypothetical protein [Salipaludibacillus daqingensis]|uniref:hypothetical protein n=1 Tax=Salipaludibacillus daqingensis TaxID=3041001 RepID=UPI0024751E50|nr:hypothetical protein [Salipaludibacillus daqingensis]
MKKKALLPTVSVVLSLGILAGCGDDRLDGLNEGNGINEGNNNEINIDSGNKFNNNDSNNDFGNE